MHEAIIDAEWDGRIMPFLLERFPQATPEELRAAKSYAYGGSVIQDMGYRSLFHLRRADIEASWEKTRGRPGGAG